MTARSRHAKLDEIMHLQPLSLPKKCKNVVWEKNNNYLCIIHIIRVRLNETIKNHQIVYESRKRFT